MHHPPASFDSPSRLCQPDSLKHFFFNSVSPLLLTIFIISGIDYRANDSLQLKVIKVDWNIDSLIFIKVTAGPFFFNPPMTRRLISVTHRSNLPAEQQQGLKTGAVRRGEKKQRKG